MYLNKNQHFIYAWRYKDDIACKIGKSTVGSFHQSRIRPALTNDYREVELLGIRLCDSEDEAKKQEKILLNYFKRIRSDREWIKLTDEVWKWIASECMDNPPQLHEFDEVGNHKRDHLIANRGNERKKRGKKKLDDGDYETAFKLFDSTIELKPKDAEAYLYRGIATFQYEGAKSIMDFEKAISLDPNLSEAYLYRGMCKSLQGKEEEALSDIDRSISINPEKSEAYMERGNIKRVLKCFEEAITDYDRAISLLPNCIETYLYRGLAKIEIKQYSEAIRDFDYVIRIKPDDSNVYYHRGVAKFGIKRKDAMDDFLKAKQLERHYNTVRMMEINHYLNMLNE